MQTQELRQPERIYTVSELNQESRLLLEENFASLWIEGEISNFAAPNSGHWYFSLKDATAQVRCAMFKSQQRKLNFLPKNGLHVLLKVRVSLYEARGEYQLIAEEMEERGEGKLRRAFEALKKKLELAGLFSQEHKKSLPNFPERIGVITSATGAAIRDILTVLKRRYPSAQIVIYPTLVQGEMAAPAIAKAIELANLRQDCEVLILARGGGSLEDLWAFNEEIVAYAIFKSSLPIITGIGHEVDFTIADFVADQRAPTPSAAAEILTPDGIELLQNLQQYYQQLLRHMNNRLRAGQQQLAWTHKHLWQAHPKKRLLEKMQHLDYCELTLVKLQTHFLNQLQNNLKDLTMKLHKGTPLTVISQICAHIHLTQEKMNHALQVKLAYSQNRFSQMATTLHALSPLATLNRGYAIVSSPAIPVIRDADAVKIQDEIQVNLAKGRLHCIVKDKSIPTG